MPALPQQLLLNSSIDTWVAAAGLERLGGAGILLRSAASRTLSAEEEAAENQGPSLNSGIVGKDASTTP